MTNEVIKLSAHGKSQRDIAKTLGLSQPKVNRILRSARNQRSKTGDASVATVPSGWSAPRTLKPGDLRRLIRQAVAAKVAAAMVSRALPLFSEAEARDMLDHVEDDAFWASPA